MGNCRYIRNLLNRVNRRGLYPLGTEGARWRRRLCKRVMFAVAQGGGSEKVLKIDQPSAGGFLVLTALGAEGCGIAIGHACGVRVQRVHKVQRIQRVVVSLLRSDEFCNSDSRNGKPYNRATPVGNAPLLPTEPPPEREVYSPFSFWTHKHLKA